MAPPLVFHPDYTYPLPPWHRFPMGKFGRIREVLIEDGVVGPEAFQQPEPIARELLEAAHTPAYVDAVLSLSLDRRAERRLGLPLSEALVRRARAAVGGTLLTLRLALERGLACNMAGGSHHAHPDHGAGFCVFNDVAVALRALQREGWQGRALVFDLDVHQGDGTAAFFLMIQASSPARSIARRTTRSRRASATSISACRRAPATTPISRWCAMCSGR